MINVKKVKNYILLISIVVCLASCRNNQSSTSVVHTGNTIEFGNSSVKAIIKKCNNKVEQKFYARKNNDWIEVVSSFSPPEEFPISAVQLFNSKLDPDHRFLVNSLLHDFKVESETNMETVVLLWGKIKDVIIEQRITLEKDKDFFHFNVALDLKDSLPKLDYALSTFTFNLEHAPKFVHTPGLKFDNEDSKQNRFKLLPGKDQIIGDRAFHAPAIILQEEGQFAALVPDLNAINKFKITSPDARKTIDIGRNKFSAPFEKDKYTMPTGLDLNLLTGLTKKPVMTYGYMDNIIAHHIHYQRVNDSSMVRSLDNEYVRYEFDLFVGSDTTKSTGFQKITKHQWTKFGRPVFKNRPHLGMPFEEYFRIIDSITFSPSLYPNIDIPLKGFKDTGSWLEWEKDGQKFGGYRSSINWWNDVMHNSSFWNNAREAQGFWHWGNKLNRPDIIEKGRQIINWCLAAPRNEQGLFALQYNANDKKWVTGFSDPVNEKFEFFLRESDSYDVSTMSKTAAHLLDYHLRCEKDERIVDYLIPYGNWLLTVIDERGAVPSYIDQKDMTASDILKYSAQPSSSMWFLAELYNATNEQKYLQGAEKISKFLEKEILPEQKWIDMEQFFSCGKRPFEFVRDQWQNQLARGNLSLFWAIEGFSALYRATGDERILDLGERCVDYVSFTQTIWEPHFIYTAFPFGGFTVDNADNATFLDARQAEMVRPFIWYGKILGRQDLLERGVAAARSSVVLMNHPRHISNNIYRHPNIYPFGLGPENIDHEAHPQSAMRTHPSWGEGSGVFTGLAEVGRALGGVYIDFGNGLQVGVDGLTVQNAAIKGNIVTLGIDVDLASLEVPWNQEYVTDMRIGGLKGNDYLLAINDVRLGVYSGKQLESLKLKITKNAKFEIID